ncbi:right-handed parallel beta-helix repeat-containing protein [Priestia megaterium]
MVNKINEVDDVKVDVTTLKDSIDAALLSGQHADQVSQKVGDLNNLSTDVKGDLVGAINSTEAKVKDMASLPSDYVWTANAGQLEYTLPSGSFYDIGLKGFQVEVAGGIAPPNLINKINSTKFALLLPSTEIYAGFKVVARWDQSLNNGGSGTGGNIGDAGIHHTAHELGGIDEIDVTKLKGYATNVSGKIGDTSTLQTTSKTSLVSSVNELVTKSNTNSSDITNVSNKIGNLGSLQTSVQTSIVDAINSINSGYESSPAAIGSLEDLHTENKSSIVNAINENSDKIGVLQRTPNEYEWTATAGQLTYPLPTNTSYDINSKVLEVMVGGAFVSPSMIQKDSATQFTLLVDPSRIPDGIKVVARWTEPVVAGNSTSTHHFSHEEANVIEDYGALTNALGNVATLIQQAIDECSSMGVSVYVPKGDYYLEKSLIAKKGLKMILHKDARMLRYHNDCMVLNGVFGDTLGQSDIWIEGGQWDCRGHIINDDGSAFAMGYANNITLRNLKIYNVNFSHGMEICAINGADIEFCEGYGFIDNTGTRTAAEFIQIEAGTTSGFPYFGTGDGTISKKIRVRRCKASSSDVAGAFNVGVGTHSSPSVQAADNVVISDCDFTTVIDTGIASNGYTNLIIEKTKIKAKKGIKVAHDNATLTNVILRDNDVVATESIALSLDGVTLLIADHNRLDGYVNGIYGVRCKDIDISNKNDISGQTSDAVAIITNSSNIQIQRNIIRKAGRHGFNIYDNATHYRVRDNEVIDVVTNVFNLAGSNTKLVYVTGNLILDTTLTNVVSATSGVDKLIFKDNSYSSSITTPISSSATNSNPVTTENQTF